MAVQKILVLDPTAHLPAELTPNTTSAGAGDSGKLVALNSAGALDITLMPSGIGSATLTLTASESISAGALVNVSSSGQVRNANATDATKPAIGFVLASIASAASGTVYFNGSINSGATGLTAGSPVYLSTSSGVATSTAPSATGNLVQQVSATAISTTEFVANLAPGIIHG